jgi:hypothetical protein
MTDEPKCAGSCNGNRACKFPGRELGCGTKFCNTSTEAARFSCDGKGGCDLALEKCASFTCENNECRKTCAEQNDCQKTHFCNQMGLCQERLGNGLGCGNDDQCKSGFCVVEGGSGVCCNSGCSTAEFGPGASCKVAGSIGQCKCSVNCGAGSCRLYYQDFDGDTFGNKDGTPPTTAKVGCDNAPPPVGYVADRTDCDDQDNRAKPGQTAWFADQTLGKGLRDFNCDGVISKELREDTGGICYVCTQPVPKTCSASQTCPANSTVQTRLNCDLYQNLIFCLPGNPCPPSYSCGSSTFFANKEGFAGVVNCGDNNSSYVTCGTCPGSAIATNAAEPKTTRQQRCH